MGKRRGRLSNRLVDYVIAHPVKILLAGAVLVAAAFAVPFVGAVGLVSEFTLAIAGGTTLLAGGLGAAAKVFKDVFGAFPEGTDTGSTGGK